MLSRVEHEKKVYNLKAWSYIISFFFNMPHFNYLWFMIKVYLEIKKKTTHTCYN